MKIDATSVPSIADAVGDFLRSWRAAHGVTLAEVATEAHLFGARWSASSVSNIERGQAALTLPVLLILALTLGRLSGEPMKLSALLGDVEAVNVPFAGHPEKPALRSWIDGALSGDVVELTSADHGNTVSLAVSPHDAVAATPPTLAETRAAKRLGISTRDLRLRAYSLWGRPLEQEVADLAGGLATPQARGRVTRRLTEEIRRSM